MAEAFAFMQRGRESNEAACARSRENARGRWRGSDQGRISQRDIVGFVLGLIRKKTPSDREDRDLPNFLSSLTCLHQGLLRPKPTKFPLPAHALIFVQENYTPYIKERREYKIAY